MQQSDRKIRRIKPEMLARINNASAKAQGRVADRVIATLLMVTDQRKSDRLASGNCKACFYLHGYSLAGQGFTAWECLYCTNTGHRPTTAVPRVCEACSHELQLCRDCGGHLEMSIVSRLPRNRQSMDYDKVLPRLQLLLDVMQASRKYLGTAKLARIVDVSFNKTDKDLARLAGAGLIIRLKETGRQGRWRLADSLVVCPKCRHGYNDHHLDRVNDRLEWMCDKPIPK